MTDPYVGHLALHAGLLRHLVQPAIHVYNADREHQRERIGRLLKMHANKREEINQVCAGDIAAVVGLRNVVHRGHDLRRKDPVVLESMDFPEPVIRLAIEPKPRPTRRSSVWRWPN